MCCGWAHRVLLLVEGLCEVMDMDALTILGHMPDYDKHSEHDKTESWEHYDV